jgi:hypothetical protein
MEKFYHVEMRDYMTVTLVRSELSHVAFHCGGPGSRPGQSVWNL